MTKRSFEFKDGKSQKFWNIECDGPNHTVQYGRIGTQGRWNTKQFNNPEKAAKDSAKLIALKLKKGYTEITDKNAESPFEDIYLVSDKIFPVPVEDIDELEKAIGSLPYGYRELLHRCGGYGDLLDEISVWPPEVILGNVERNREYMTFSHCVDGIDEVKGLVEQDFDDICVFGLDGNGNKFCYFPRHNGTLFNLVHGATEVVRHDRAFRDVGQLWCEARVRHPFPYFTPTNRNVKRYRSLQHFMFQSNLRPVEIAEIILRYWECDETEKSLVELPPQSDDDDRGSVMAFIKMLGAWICVGRDEEDDPGTVSGLFESDKEHHSAVRKCLKEIEKKLEL